MKGFRFPLATLLRVRRLREDQAKLELARLVQALNLSRETLSAARERRTRVMQEWLGPEDRSVSGKDYQLAQKYLVALKRQIAELKVAIAEQEAAVAEKQAQLRILLQERQLLEALREKKLQEFRTAQARALQNEADENALLRYGR